MKCNFPSEVTLIFVILSVVRGATRTENAFVKVYGNDVDESGKWKPINKLRNMYPDILKNICSQAHELAGFGPPTASVRSAFFSRNKLRCWSNKYKTVTVDYLKYGLGIKESDYLIHYIWYITKGLKSDCVFYLDKIDMMATELRLTDIHVCGIKMPPMPSYATTNNTYDTDD